MSVRLSNWLLHFRDQLSLNVFSINVNILVAVNFIGILTEVPFRKEDLKQFIAYDWKSLLQISYDTNKNETFSGQDKGWQNALGNFANWLFKVEHKCKCVLISKNIPNIIIKVILATIIWLDFNNLLLPK